MSQYSKPSKPSGAGRPQLSPRVLWRRYQTLLWGSRTWLAVVSVFFLASFTGGVIGALLYPEVHQDFIRRVSESLEPTLTALRQSDYPRAIGMIFWRNLVITLLTIGTGALVFAMPWGMLTVGSNGYLLGVVAVLADRGGGALLATLLPHAIFELPALLIAAAWSLKMALQWLLPSAAGRRGDVWRDTVMEGLWIVPLVTLLLAIAAIVEVLISGQIARSLAA